MQSIKNRVGIILLILCPLILIGLHTYMLINYGLIRDEYDPVVISANLENMIWFSFFLSIFVSLFIFAFILCKKEFFAKLLLVLSILFSFVQTYNYFHFSKKYPLNVAEKTDYIENQWLQGILLDQIDDYTSSSISNDSSMVYIGRDDCLDCQEFEKELIKQCEIYSYQMPVYYTNLDRDDNYDKMNEILNKYEVTKVPALLVTKQGKVIKKISEVNQLDAAMKEYMLE